MVLLALSFQGQVEKYGVYVGIAAFFGLAVLSLLTLWLPISLMAVAFYLDIVSDWQLR